MSFKTGDMIGVPCSIQPGAFLNERLIRVQTKDGPLTGFTNTGNLESADEPRGLIAGTVIEASEDSVTVKLFGEFFTSALGFAAVRPQDLTHLAA